MTNIPSARESQQEPFRVGGPADILAFIPHSLGFAPQESLVLMTMNTARLGATLRLDLPAAALDYRGYAARVAELLRSDESADGVLMAVYTDRAWKRADSPPYLRLVTALGECLADAGLPIRDGWLVSAATWRDYFCGDNACCPWPGHPLGQISDSSLSAEMVFRGSAYARTLDEAVGQDQPAPWEHGRETAAHARAFACRISGHWCRYPQFSGTLAVWDRFFTEPAAPAGAPGERPRGCAQLRADPEAAGFLLASLRARPVRDTLLVMAALGRSRAVAGAAACGLLTADARRPVLPSAHAVQADSLDPDSLDPLEPDRKAGADFRSVLVGQYGQAPDWRGLDAASLVFAELLAAAQADPESGDEDGEAAAALLSLLAWAEWARGRGSRAQIYLARCLDSHPGYRLAELLQELLATGMFPAWAQNPATAWKGAAGERAGRGRE
ncbi:DUF4192 domain-containing protein [Arthrobacter sp. zg-ZUI100]|uniref:DUF4192 domain-containing protein n=1 Tax=Arthrobacter jiangjiafuii TaxID=2817475 RepID=UPI001AEE7DB1|nr:DUF4192 domain-containing protein [Arthrobacter jiangjiafuii]MBP3036807.1 DUF4192 domain-containing protein [Arthrobacter jiangjiafuii]